MTIDRADSYEAAKSELLDAADAALAGLEDAATSAGSYGSDAVIADVTAFGRMVRSAKRLGSFGPGEYGDPAAEALVRAVSRAEARRTAVLAKPPYRPGGNGHAQGLPGIDAVRVEVAAEWARHGLGEESEPDLGVLLLARYRGRSDWRADGANPVDAFVKHGFGDGDREVFTDDVGAWIEAMTGWCAGTAWMGAHNCVIASLDEQMGFGDWRMAYQFDPSGAPPDWERMPARLQRALRTLGVENGEVWRERWNW